MRNVFCTALLLTTAFGLGACSGDPLCEKPEVYQSSVVGKRIEAPEGLTALVDYKELKIPEASPRTGEKQAGCVDKPPKYYTE